MTELPGFNARKLLITTFLLVIFSSVGLAYASSEGGGEKEESKTAFIMHHIKDSHEWHFMTIGHTHVSIPLPVIIYEKGGGLKFFMSSDFYDEEHHPKFHEGYMIDDHDEIIAEDGSHDFYDLSITKNTVSLFISIIALILIFTSVAKRYKKHQNQAPKGLQSFLEPVIVFIRDEVVIPSIGEKHYSRFMPYLLTLFFFILFNNLLGLTPGAANLSGNIAFTSCLAILTFIITNVNGKSTYWTHIFATPGVPILIRPIILMVEVIGVFTKPISLMVRLFASMTAGHIVVLSIMGLGFIIESVVVGFLGTAFATLVNLIEILVAFIQAYVFTLFSSMYIGLALEEKHH